MATPAEDLQNKLKLEEEFRPILRKYNRKVINSFIAQYKDNATIFNANEFDDDLQLILSDHYKKTSDIFSNNIGPDLPEDVEPTDLESETIAAALAAYFLLQSSEKANLINNTTNDDLNKSIAEASEDEQSSDLVGRERIITVATLGAVFASRKLNSRTESIVQTETQLAAETSKGTEAEVLSGREPSVVSASPVKSIVSKRWDTVGDSRVRESHLSADSQKKPISEPFIVGGEQLKWPGDTSLGASLGNIINCRCGTTYNEKDIIKSRRSL